jgi:hypothetical protein
VSASRCSRVAARFPYLQQIVCRCGTIASSDIALARVAQYLLPELRYLRLLDLRGCSITEEGAAVLADVLPSCPSLREVRLGSNDIGSDGATALAHAVADQRHRVEELRRRRQSQYAHGEEGGSGNSSGSGGGSGGGVATPRSPGLASMLRAARAVHDGDRNHDGRSASARPRADSPTDDDDEDLVHTLDLSSNDIRDVGLAPITRCIADDGIPLRGLDVWSNSIGATALCDLCDAVAQQDCRSLRRLDIGRNTLSGSVLAAVVRVLREPRVRLYHVGIEQTFHGGGYAHRIEAGGADGDAADIAAVIAAVGACPSLTSVDFTGHGILPSEVPPLVSGLQLSRIRDLFLGSNSLGDAGAQTLARAIVGGGKETAGAAGGGAPSSGPSGGLQDSLRALGLSCNGIGGGGARALVQAFSATPSRKWKLLDLSHNVITAEVAETFAEDAVGLGELPERNRFERRLDLTGNPCVADLAVASAIATVADAAAHSDSDPEDDSGLGGMGLGVMPNLWSLSWWSESEQQGGESKGGNGGDEDEWRTGLRSDDEDSFSSSPTRSPLDGGRGSWRSSGGLRSSHSGSDAASDLEAWHRVLKRARGVIVASPLDGLAAFKLHGFSLHSWQGRLRRNLSNFKGIELE